MATRRRSAGIVGRETELAELRRFVRALPSAPGPTALVLAGHVGIGKTTLWAEGVAEAGRRSIRVLSCRPGAAEAHYPYAGLGDLLEEVADDVVASLSGAPRRALEVALLRAEPAGHALEPRAVAAAVRSALVHLAEAAPLLLAVDDVQWLDRPSARALSFALRRIGPRPVGVLLSLRRDAATVAAAPLDVDRAFGPGRVVSLPVGPLAAEPLERLLAASGDGPLPRDVLDRLHATSEGNPFFALELAQAAARRGTPLQRGEALPVPDSLRAVVQERLAELSPASREALLAASALTRPTPALVDAAAGTPPGGAPSGEDGREALADAVEAGVLEVQGDRVRLAHPLLASVAYADAAADHRRALHARLARLVHDPEERARHLALAARGPDEAVATALDLAARRAAARGAPDVAAGLTEQALRFTPPERAEAVRRRSFEAGDRWFAAGDMTRAGALLGEVRDSAPPGPARARALQRLGELRAQEQGFAGIEALFLQALDETGEDRLLRLEVECDLAFTRLISGDIPGAADRTRSALELAESLQAVPPTTMLTVLVCAALFDFLLGRRLPPGLLERAMALEDWIAREAVALRPGYLHLPHVSATILKWSDDLEGARARYAAAHARTTELGDESWLPWLLYHLAELECWAGRWEEAARHGTAACEVAERTGQKGVGGFTLYATALVAAHRGDLGAARRHAEEGVAVSEATGTVTAAQLNRAVLGFAALSEGDTHGALGHLARVRKELGAIGLANPGIVRCLPNEIEALVGTGDLDQAAALADHLVEQGEALGNRWALAAGARCQGLLRAAVADWDGALDRLAAARTGAEGLGQPFELGRTLLTEGAVRRRARQKRAARDALDAAAVIFDGLGAPRWADKARAEIARIGGRPRTPETLTPTEERVAGLVALGWTNREVATSLFMSVKTVESNLRQIYRKFGISSRRELSRLHLPAGGAPASTPADTATNRPNGVNRD